MGILRSLARLRSSRWRPVPFVLLAAFVAKHAASSRALDGAPSRSAALARALELDHGLHAEADDVVWLEAPGRGVGLRRSARAVVRARVGGSPSDLFLAEATLSPEGQLLSVGGVHDLTRSGSVDEGRPVASGRFVAYTTELDGAITAVHVLDAEGRAAPDEFTTVQRLQTRVTDWQATGQARGVAHDVYTLASPTSRVELSWSKAAPGHLEAKLDGGETLDIDAATGAISPATTQLASARREEKARPPSLAPWAVDRVRAVAWLGEEKMQYVKAVAFTGLELFYDARSRVVKDKSASEVESDLGGVNAGKIEPASFTDPEIGWPPAPMTPVITPALPNEGQWIALDKDPFITQTKGAPPAFVTSFVRSDPKRSFTRVYVTMWDPRQVALHMEAGTVEPVSATGAAGPGVVPRTPEVVRRLVGGFNGGFQATHGEFGMQANGILYLPPKPYAATILELRDGSTAFGSWPRATEVPDEVISYRQNLTALVQDGKINPWGRTWWGGTPIGWADNIHTTRSGVCLTKEGYVGYFWGTDMAPEVLAAGMLAARCAYGVHLDMNPGLAGFEFYNVQPAADFKPLGRPLQGDWEYEGTIKDLPDFRVRARRMIKGMIHMNFPQYVQRHGRDFFYLTARPVLPGAPLPRPDGAAGDGAWRTKGLPQHGFPYAVATATAHGDGGLALRAARFDPHAIAPGTSGKLVVAFDRPAAVPAVAAPPLVLTHDRGVFDLGPTATAGATVIARGAPAGSPAARGARAAVGVRDDDGMLDWVELLPGALATDEAARAMDKLLERAGCRVRMLVVDGTRPVLGGAMDLAGDPSRAEASATRFVRAPAPGARPYFEGTPIVGADTWLPLQSQRVRYFKKGAPAATSAAPNASTTAPR